MSGVQPNQNAPLTWRKSSFSSLGNCVEVAANGEQVLVRDSKDPAGPWIRYTAAEWDAFLRGAKNGDFDNLP
jgi:hypothetical protein